MNVNCVIRLDNHVILYQFASSISGLPIRRVCACRAALPFCHMIVSNPASYPFSEHADSAQPIVKESREGLGPRLGIPTHISVVCGFGMRVVT